LLSTTFGACRFVRPVSVLGKVGPRRILFLALDTIALEGGAVEPIDRIDRQPSTDNAGTALHV
jgi:hypothetical protein